jgi:hypothetical protein
MPNMDKTGPLGDGPTGRGRGGCENKQSSGFFGFRGFGRKRNCQTNGNGMGRGMGRDRCCQFSNLDEKDYIVMSIKSHEKSIEELKKRLEEIK